MGESKLGTTVRAAIKAAFQARSRRHMPSAARFRAVPHKPRLSTRGERGDTWHTKQWTKMRRQYRDETLERRRMQQDKAAKAEGRADHVARHDG